MTHFSRVSVASAISDQHRFFANAQTISESLLDMKGSQTTPDILCKPGTAEASPLSRFLSHPGGESILSETACAGVSRAWDAV